mgnify:FL=1
MLFLAFPICTIKTFIFPDIFSKYLHSFFVRNSDKIFKAMVITNVPSALTQKFMNYYINHLGITRVDQNLIAYSKVAIKLRVRPSGRASLTMKGIPPLSWILFLSLIL